MPSYAAIDRSIAKLGEMIEQRRGAPKDVKHDLTRRIEARRSWINEKIARRLCADIAAEATIQAARPWVWIDHAGGEGQKFILSWYR